MISRKTKPVAGGGLNEATMINDIPMIDWPIPEGKVGFWLGSALEGCPEYWQNFVSFANPWGNDVARIGELLNEFRAVNPDLDSSGPTFMEFEDAKAVLFFMMRWA